MKGASREQAERAELLTGRGPSVTPCRGWAPGVSLFLRLLSRLVKVF